MGNEHFRETFGNPGSAEEGIIVSIYNLGAFAGCIVNFFIGERMGRRLCMWVAMGFIVSRSDGESGTTTWHVRNDICRNKE